MAITRAQQVRQMLKDGEVAMQGSKKPAKNYLGKQETVSGVPVKWQSGPDAPPTELAYITKKEKDLLLKADLHGSLKDGPNTGPDGIMSLDSQGDYTRDRSSGAYDSGPAGDTGGGNTQQDLRNRAMNEQRMKDILTGQVDIGQTSAYRGPTGDDLVQLDSGDFVARKDLKDVSSVGGVNKQFNFMDIINPTARRKALYNLTLGIPGQRDRIIKYRKAYEDYLKSMGVTPTDELSDTDNLFDFFEKQAFEKGKTIYSDPTVANQEIYDKLLKDNTGPFSNADLRSQLEKYTQEEFMAQNPDLFSKGTPKEIQSYGDFILENFGTPGVKFSGDVGNKEVYVKGYREDGSKIYGVKERRDGGGGDGGIF